MKVYVLEVFWGDEWQVEGVFSTEEAATQEGEKVLTHSARYVEYEVSEHEVK